MLVSFKANRITTAGATLISPTHIITARLVANTTADMIVQIHDAAATSGTSASTRVATLFTTNPGVDETGAPIRTISGGCVVVAPTGVSAGALYVYNR